MRATSTSCAATRSIFVPVTLLILALARPLEAADLWPVIRPGISEGETKIIETLEEKASLEFFETPLSEVATYLSDRHAIPVAIDGKSLEEAGKDTSTPVTIRLQGLTLRAGLGTLLPALDLGYIVDNELLMITTAEKAAAHRHVWIYDVTKLLRDGTDVAELAQLIDEAMELNEPQLSNRGDNSKCIACRTTTRILPHRHVLIVSASLDRQRAVAAFLKGLEQALKPKPGKDPFADY